jgi:hypothetical protein
LIPFVGGFIPEITKIIQIFDGSIISITGQDLCCLHDVMAKYQQWIDKAMFLPVLQQGHVQTNMRCIDPGIIGYGSKELRELTPLQHRKRF